MYYLIQSNITKEPHYDRIFTALDELGLSYDKIELYRTTKQLELSVDRKDVFVCGSVKLARMAKEHTDWYPGSFYGGNHLFEVYSERYKGHVLNGEIEVFKFGEPISWSEGEQKFIKPYKNAKLFTGKLFTQLKWEDFVKQALLAPKTPLLNENALMQASVPKAISKEARLWIIGGQIVASAYYKFHGNVLFEEHVAEEGIRFAKRMIQQFEVAEAFVMDICLSEDGWKIVEVNCINSAGFYPNMSVKAVFKALEIYFSK
ncbi:MAG: ATP-grasp domain-containing protein [Saprospiraceae bacterium]|nr:ATP-grasp domain-containing protein [Saprospiraceae bacterium]